MSAPHVQIEITYKPYGIIDFNRPDILAGYFRSKLPVVIWLDELPQWKGEKDAYLALKSDVSVKLCTDTEAKK